MVENDIRDRVKEALSRVIDSHKYVINVDVDLEVLDEVNEQITVFAPRESTNQAIEKRTPEEKTAEALIKIQEKMVNDILIMGRLDVFVEEGKHETIVLNYQSLEEDVIDYNKRFQTGTWTGFSLFFLMILLMSWGLA